MKDIPAIKERILHVLSALRRYSLVMFLLFLLGIYGFLSLRVLSLTQAQPDPTAVSAKLKTAGVPHIDPEALKKIQDLEDNSVEVQTLFEQARNSPFEE